jgi:hypothetical protein
MKVQSKMLFLVVLMIMTSTLTWGAIKYGEATIDKGNMVIVRDGRMYLYTTANNPVVLYENDTVRTLKDTAITFNNPDQHRIILGANAIMQLKKWRQQEEQGSIRLLFGKFRARTAAVRKQSSLNMRTATATIGIKGSLGEGATNSNFTSLSNLGGQMSMTTNQGEEFGIPTGQMGFNVDGGNQNVGLQENPNYDPNQSEDEAETSDTDQLNTEDAKEIDLPPAIEDAIEENIVEVAEADEEPTFEPVSDDQRQTDILESIDSSIQGAQSTASEASPSIDAIIKIED